MTYTMTGTIIYDKVDLMSNQTDAVLDWLDWCLKTSTSHTIHGHNTWHLTHGLCYITSRQVKCALLVDLRWGLATSAVCKCNKRPWSTQSTQVQCPLTNCIDSCKVHSVHVAEATNANDWRLVNTALVTWNEHKYAWVRFKNNPFNMM